MRSFILTLLAALTLTLTPNEYGVVFVIASDAPRRLYVQIHAAGGARIQSPTRYEYDIGAGELFGRTIEVYGPGSVRVEVWDGGQEPAADTTFQLPTRYTYLPLM